MGRFGEEVESFIGALMYEREMAENTCLAYRRDLADFGRCLAVHGIDGASDVTPEIITSYIAGEREEGYATATRARRLAAIRMLFRHLKERKMVKTDPTELLDSPKKGLALPRVLSEEETFRMIDMVSGKDARDLRDRAMLEVMYGCGLRVSETCGMEIDDIMADGELLRVTGKGSKERLVPLGGAAGRALAEYCASARDVFSRGNAAERHMFLTRLGRPFTRQGVFKIIKARALAADIPPERISPHVLRHCFASHMLQHGADIRAIQEMLGHADIGTTQVYTHVDAARFGELHRRFHPRG
ncbi:MAG: site-specific tyrosine recombinase XerD [Kiritimatiellae bacterium]|nr:site-specific tyrosine recombinase XerD [Kiritimatiellia bacterium]